VLGPLGAVALCCRCWLAIVHRLHRWQLSETALLQLAEMGYSQVESARALRFSGGDLAAAVNFLTEQLVKQKVPDSLIVQCALFEAVFLIPCVLHAVLCLLLFVLEVLKTFKCVCFFSMLNPFLMVLNVMVIHLIWQ
jgi:hypothetical protein